MANDDAELVIQDEAGQGIDLSEENPASFGIVPSGASSDVVKLQVKNTGAVDVFFVTLRGILHPTAQVGAGRDTAEAVRFSKTENGSFEETITFDRLDAGDSAAFWARWDVPVEAPGGAMVWAIEAAASIT